MARTSAEIFQLARWTFGSRKFRNRPYKRKAHRWLACFLDDLKMCHQHILVRRCLHTPHIFGNGACKALPKGTDEGEVLTTENQMLVWKSHRQIHEICEHRPNMIRIEEGQGWMLPNPLKIISRKNDPIICLQSRFFDNSDEARARLPRKGH